MSEFSDSLGDFNGLKAETHRECAPASIEFLAKPGTLHEVAFGMVSVEAQPAEHSIGLEILRAGILEFPVSLADRGGPARTGATFLIRTAADSLLHGTKWQIHRLAHTPLEIVASATCQRIED